MKLPLSWLNNIIDIKKYSPEKIAEALTHAGSEVEMIHRRTSEELKHFNKVIVGQILEITKHPNADKLQMVIVDIGKQISKNYKLQTTNYKLTIVCGAPNIAVGQIVPVALIGASLPNGMIIERRKIRDIESEGMLCSAKELGLAEDAAGIYILSDDVKIGTPLVKALGLDEVVLSLDITPNRGDCLSVRGLAREVSVIFNKKILPHPEFLLKSQKNKTLEIRDKGLRIDLSIQVEDKKVCPFYSARAVYDVKIAESPQWIKNRLLSAGIRPINNIIDITNYVMMELGQPLHAFDLEKISSAQSAKLKTRSEKLIVVRRAKRGEKIVALDDKIYNLSDEMLVIADSEKPIAIAGVMGGRDSGVDQNTKNIILEAAEFQPSSVRKTSKLLGLKSDSSYRFERGIDSSGVETALDRAAELIKQLAGGIKNKTVSIGKKIKPRVVETSAEFISNRLGKEVSVKEIKTILASLGFNGFRFHDSGFMIQVPSWRNDISIPEDIVEEVGRIIGYGNITPTLFAIPPKEQESLRTKKEEIGYSKITKIRNIKDMLFGEGFTETMLYSFYGKKHAEISEIPPADHFQIANPINPDQEYLRVSLLPRLMEVGEKNAREFPIVKIFEIGRVFFLENQRDGEMLPGEEKMLSAILVNNEESAINNFRGLKNVVEQILKRANINDLVAFEKAKRPRAVKIIINGQEVGICGMVGSKARSMFKLPDSTAFFEISLDKICAFQEGEKKIMPILEFPSALRDVSIIVDKSVSYGQIEEVIKKASPLPLSFELFDCFEDDQKIGKEKKAMAFHLAFQLSDRTLTSEEVDGVMRKIIENLEKSVQAQARKQIS